METSFPHHLCCSGASPPALSASVLFSSLLEALLISGELLLHRILSSGAPSDHFGEFHLEILLSLSILELVFSLSSFSPSWSHS